MEDVCTTSIRHETPHLLVCFKNALKRRKAGSAVLVQAHNEHPFTRMLQGGAETHDQIPALPQGIPVSGHETHSGSVALAVTTLSQSAQPWEGSGCSQHLFLAALSRRKGVIHTTPATSGRGVGLASPDSCNHRFTVRSVGLSFYNLVALL